MDNLTKENNNFNLVRLFACIQVLVLHTFNFYHVGEDALFIKVIWLFPGVIIFFAVSGFLIAKSYENSDSKSFALKRFFRIFPALAVNILVTVILLYAFGYIKLNLDLLKYLIAQLTLFQFYTPESMKVFGSGHHPNGALWTISIELQFYIIFFIISNLIKWKSKTIAFKNILVISLMLTSTVVNYATNKFINFDSLNYKLLFNSIPYHFTFFGLGILFWVNFKQIKSIFIEKVNYWFLALLTVVLIILIKDIPVYRYQYDGLSYIYLVLLLFFIFSFAFSNPKISYSLLKNNDISYGIYIYHCLVINLFLQLKLSTNYFIIIYMLSILLGLISWTFIEKRFLIKKAKPTFS